MDKIQLLQERKATLVKAGKEIREQINALIDEKSFVELSAFSFSKNEFFDESVAGEEEREAVKRISDIYVERLDALIK